MNAYFRIAVTALCGMLLGLPAAQAQQSRPLTKSLLVEIGLSEENFSAFPNNLTLKAGEYYRLELVNWSQGIRHIVMAPEFGQAVVTSEIRRLPHRQEMRGAGFDTGIDLPPGGRVEVFFVPYKAGRYKLFCQDRVHTDAGMDVSLEVRL